MNRNSRSCAVLKTNNRTLSGPGRFVSSPPTLRVRPGQNLSLLNLLIGTPPVPHGASLKAKCVPVRPHHQSFSYITKGVGTITGDDSHPPSPTRPLSPPVSRLSRSSLVSGFESLTPHRSGCRTWTHLMWHAHRSRLSCHPRPYHTAAHARSTNFLY